MSVWPNCLTSIRKRKTIGRVNRATPLIHVTPVKANDQWATETYVRRLLNDRTFFFTIIVSFCAGGPQHTEECVNNQRNAKDIASDLLTIEESL